MAKIFSEKGTITDIEVKRGPSGKSRRFAFVGYHDERDAEEAIRSLNHTFINTTKIQVERCRSLTETGTFTRIEIYQDIMNV